MAEHFAHLAFIRDADRHAAERIEFTPAGKNVLDSEALTDAAYKVFLTLLARGYGSRGSCVDFGPRDIVELLVHGVYLPCVERVTFLDQVDQRTDGLPQQASVAVLDSQGECSVYHLRRIPKFPRPICQLAAGARYKMVEFLREEHHRNRKNRRWPGFLEPMGDDVLMAYDSYFTVTPDDRIVHTIDPRTVGMDGIQVRHACCTVWPAYAMNVYADRTNLWQVQTTEHVLETKKTPLTLGVAESHIKSLFYARSLPVTETGRKRPILHWVKAHARRLAEGIDVDVNRHLRGITAFEMDGLSFQIISPEKPGVAP
jgi:hypothetical protein